MEAKEKQKLIDDCIYLIDEYLKFCNEKSTPYVCKLKDTEGGVEQIKNYVINRMMAGKPVGEAIMELERQLDPIYSDF